MLDILLKVWYYVYMMKKHTIQNTLKWLGTFTLILGTGINSLGIYPLGPLVMVLGGLIWCIVGIMCKEISLIITNLTLSIVSIVGICYTMGYFS